MTDQVLSGVRVLDLSRWVAGEYATKLFADFGADVVKVERPGEGSLTRAWGPFPDDVPDPERSALFLHLNTNKRSVALDLRDDADREVLLDLVRSAHAVVESFRPGHLEELGLGPDVLRAINPGLVLTRISAFGQTGPYRDREATGLVLQGAGGPMHATGQADRAPLRKPGLLEHYTVGRTAAQATMARAAACSSHRSRRHHRRLGPGGPARGRRPPGVVPALGVVLRHHRAARRPQPAPPRSHVHRPLPRGRRLRHGLRHQPGLLEPLRAPDRGRRPGVPGALPGPADRDRCGPRGLHGPRHRLDRGATRRSR